MTESGLQDNSKAENNNGSGDSVPSGPFKWFVLVTYVTYSSSLAMSEIIFAPIPKQTAAYYGIKGKYFDYQRKIVIHYFKHI